MKKFIYFPFIALASLMIASCDNDNKKEIFPEEYYKVLYLKNSGTRTYMMNTTMDDVVDSLLIVKAGAKPQETASVHLAVLSKKETAGLWGYDENSFEIIPESSYSFADGQDFNFGSDEFSKYAPISLNPMNIYEAQKIDPSKLWVLPILLESPDSASINKNKNKVLMIFNVNAPLVEWAFNSQTVDIIYRTAEIPVKAVISNSNNNTINFKAIVSAPDIKANVEAYNNSNNTNYEPLPESSFSITDNEFKVGSLEATSVLKLTREGLVSDHQYLLPIRITSLSTDKVEYSDDVRYIIVNNPKYCYEDMDQTKFSIAYVSSDYFDGDWRAKFMIDGTISKGWGSPWSTNGDVKLASDNYDDYCYPDENSNFTFNQHHKHVEYPSCFCVRPYNKIVFVIDLKETVPIFSVGVEKQSDRNLGNGDLKGFKLYTEDQFVLKPAAEYSTPEEKVAAIKNYNTAEAGNNWRFCLDWKNIPRGTSAGLPTTYQNIPDEYLNTPVAKGRYLRFLVTDSYRPGANTIQLGELYVRKLLSVDGYTAQ